MHRVLLHSMYRCANHICAPGRRHYHRRVKNISLKLTGDDQEHAVEMLKRARSNHRMCVSSSSSWIMRDGLGQTCGHLSSIRY